MKKPFQLAIVDVPYGININNNIGRRKADKKSTYKPIGWDDNAPIKEYFDLLFSLSDNQIIWGANHFIEKIPYKSNCWIVWDKKWIGNDVSFSQCELAWTSFKSSTKKFISTHNTKDRIHPTQKPVALYKWLLKNYAKEGDTILDTHLGSMSIAIACHDLGFDLTGYEIDKDYYEAGIKRVNQHIAQGNLFHEQPKQIVEQKKLEL